MYVAISAVIASVSVVLLLSALTLSGTSTTLLTQIIDFKTLPPSDASSVLLYSVLAYVVTFSVTLFILRFLGLFLATLGLPNEDSIRRNRELRQMNDAQKRQARLIAHYILRAQAEVAQRRVEEATRRTFSEPLPPLASQPLQPVSDPKRTTSQPRTR